MKNSNKGISLVWLLLIGVVFITVLGFVVQKFDLKKTVGSKNLPVYVKPLTVNRAVIDIDGDDVEDVIAYHATQEDCGSSGCRLYVNDSVAVGNSYPPIYGVFDDKKLSHLIVNQSVNTPGCDAESCMKVVPVLYEYTPGGLASKLKEDVEVSDDALLIFSNDALKAIYNSGIDVSEKIYKNEKYGLEFKYPKDWVMSEKENTRISSTEFKNIVIHEINFHEKAALKMSAFLYPKEYTTYGASANAFKNGYEKHAFFYGPLILERIVNGYKVVVNYRGCFECNERPKDELEKVSSWIVSMVCNSKDVCLQFNLIDSGGIDKKDFIVEKLLPTLKIGSHFENIEYTFYEGVW